MRLILLTAFLLFFVTSSYGQNNKSKWIYNISFHNTSCYSKLFYSLLYEEGGYPTKQRSATFFDFNIIYTRPTENEKIKIVYGMGGNQKGYYEKGMQSGGTPDHYYTYERKIKTTYISLLAGASYHD